jgi:hypothetical protein
MALIVVLQNMSNLTPISDYKAEVYVNDLPIWRGEVKEHKREEGWTVLVKKLVQVASKDTTDGRNTETKSPSKDDKVRRGSSAMPPKAPTIKKRRKAK